MTLTDRAGKTLKVWAVTLAIALISLSCSKSADVSVTAAEPEADQPATSAEPTVPPTAVPPTAVAPTPEPPPPEPPTPEPPPPEPPTPEPPAPEPPDPIVIGEPDDQGVVEVVIDGDQLAPLFDNFMEGDDPLFLIHTQQDDVFVGVELYTVFGASWTGELGTFPTDCTTHGICIYLDPDGTGPLVGGGPGTGTGTVTIVQLEGSSIVTLDNVTIQAEDGQVYTMNGVTLRG